MGRVVASVCLVVALLAPSVARAESPGRTTTGSFVTEGREYRFVRYVPASIDPGRPAPLVVLLHGAQTTAEQIRRATGYDEVADREGFVILYPDVDERGRSAPGPLRQSWTFYDPATYARDGGDVAAVAAMTRATMDAVAIDHERVYVVGVSAGGLIASVAAAAYPDLFAASGNVTSAGFLDAPCFATGVGIPVELGAALAFAQMGPRARVVPTVVMTSDADLAFPARCGDKAVEQALRTNNLALSGTQDAPLALTPADVRRDRVPGGHAFEVAAFRDPEGCLVAERWLVRGMPHAWPGGQTTDPRFTGFTDRRAPNGAEATWAFLRRYTRAGTAPGCSEAPTVAPVTTVPRRCAARWVRLRAPTGGRVRTVSVDGRRVRFTRGRTTVRVRLSATRRARARVVVRARTPAGREIVRRVTVSRCR